MDNKTEWRRSRDRLVRTLTSLGFPGELGNAIVKNLGSPRAMDRMTVYLENVKPNKVEVVVDEMLAIRSEIEAWSDDFESVTARSYMRGYRDIFKDMNLLHKFLIMFCDIAVKMKIMRVEFKK